MMIERSVKIPDANRDQRRPDEEILHREDNNRSRPRAIWAARQSSPVTAFCTTHRRSVDDEPDGLTNEHEKEEMQMLT